MAKKSMTSTYNNEVISSLITKIKDANTEALKELYNLTSNSVFAYSMSIVNNYHDAEDILQNVYINIFKSAYLFINENSPMSWILMITRNLSLMKIRKDKKLVFTEQDLEHINNYNPTFNNDNKLLIEYLLNNLKEDEKQIVILYSMNGYKHKEIAQLLDIPLSTVLSKYNRSIKKLQKFLKED